MSLLVLHGSRQRRRLMAHMVIPVRIVKQQKQQRSCWTRPATKTSVYNSASWISPRSNSSSSRVNATTTTRRVLSSSTDNSSDRSSSTTSATSDNSNEGFFGRIRQTFEDRSKRQQTEKYAAQLRKMADKEAWTLSDYVQDLDDAVNNWRNKIPGMSQLEQNKMAKQAQTVVKAVIEEAGGTSTMHDLNKLGRVEKLRISLKSGSSMEELNLMLKQFQAVDMMHQVLRYRKKHGKPIPTDEASMKVAVQTDAAKAVSRETKNQMKAAQRKRVTRSSGSKR